MLAWLRRRRRRELRGVVLQQVVRLQLAGVHIEQMYDWFDGPEREALDDVLDLIRKEMAR